MFLVLASSRSSSAFSFPFERFQKCSPSYSSCHTCHRTLPGLGPTMEVCSHGFDRIFALRCNFSCVALFFPGLNRGRGRIVSEQQIAPVLALLPDTYTDGQTAEDQSPRAAATSAVPLPLSHQLPPSTF